MISRLVKAGCGAETVKTIVDVFFSHIPSSIMPGGLVTVRTPITSQPTVVKKPGRVTVILSFGDKFMTGSNDIEMRAGCVLVQDRMGDPGNATSEPIDWTETKDVGSTGPKVLFGAEIVMVL